MDYTPYLVGPLGYFLIFLSVFIESGVVLGLILPLPGFSLLFTAGVFSASGKLSLLGVMGVGIVGAIGGYIVGYFTGKFYGDKLFSDKNSRFFTADQARATKGFMKKHGPLTLVIGRFLPFIHTAAPILAGFARMPFYKFMVLNVLGGIAWVVIATLLGYFLGKVVPDAEKWVIPFVIALILLSNIPPVHRQINKLSKKLERF